jgi:hypothetical protein
LIQEIAIYETRLRIRELFWPTLSRAKLPPS